MELGTKLDPYRRLPYRRGGRGQVREVTDTSLGQTVAIKVLPGDFAADPERLAQFEWEAKGLASLAHPSIGHIFGIEEPAGHANAGRKGNAGRSRGMMKGADWFATTRQGTHLCLLGEEL